MYTIKVLPVLLIVTVYAAITFVASLHCRLVGQNDLFADPAGSALPFILPTPSNSPWLSLGVLSLLIWLLGRAYREVIAQNGGSPRSFEPKVASTWRQWLRLSCSGDLEDPDGFIDKGSYVAIAVLQQGKCRQLTSRLPTGGLGLLSPSRRCWVLRR